LSNILADIQASAGPDLLVGFDTSDDAGVYRLDAERAIVSTADFITPVVDDPFTFGRVAAANSISDVYAMGGVPFMALNLLGFPQAGLPQSALSDILAGAAETCRAAGCAVAGGHTVRDDEVKFGLSVTGTVHPNRILRNSTARNGDVLVLTKPLGTGALVAANKKGRLDRAAYDALVTCMTTLNKSGERLWDLGANACTDVTGFGLSGHALEMAKGSGLRLEISCGALPQLPEAAALCGEGFTCGGTQANARFTDADLRFAPDLDPGMIGLLHDPQTSGGLLVSLPESHLSGLLTALEEDSALSAAVIGRVTGRADGDPWLTFLP